MTQKVFSILAAVWFSLAGMAYAVYYDTPLVGRFGQTGLFSCQSAKTLGMGRLSIGTYGNVSRNKDFVIQVIDENVTPNDTMENADISMTIAGFNFALGYGITRYLDLAVMLPLYTEFITQYIPNGGDEFGGNIITGLGDMEVSLKWQYPPYPHKKFFEMAYYGAMSIPTGDKVNAYFPRHAYYFYKDSSDIVDNNSEVKEFYSSAIPEVDMKMLWTFDFDQLRGGVPVEFHINYGVRWTGADLDNLFLLNSGLSFRPINWITIFTEFTGETRVSNVDRGFKIGDDPLRLSPGVILTPPGGFFITLGMDISLASKNTHLLYHADNNTGNDKKLVETLIEPQYRFAAMVGWAGFVMPQDKDKDGIKDNEDRCPKDPEDYDGFEDGDGCPEADNDQDGIPDSVDKCPNEKEDIDQFKDDDGCPDYDNDEDGVQDTQDKCPLVPEDLDGFEDGDGCPDFDNDNDGIPDSLDHCPDKPEDKDDHEDQDGCPDFDNDLDGVPDSTDKCPNEPETFNSFEDEDGCPDKAVGKPKAKEIKRGRVILRGVNFEFGKARLTTDSYSILDQVYASLVEWPEIKIEIRGHTDSVGSRMSNKRLSNRRANAVRDYLISKGISPDRMMATGMGEDEPIAENSTAEGRAMNRRVELHRID